MTIPIQGPLTVREAAETRQAWLSALAAGHESEVVLDVTGLTSIDTAGVQLVLALRRECESLGGRLTVQPGGGALAEGCERLALEL